MTAVDWSRYQKCPVCGAPLGEACASIVAGYTTEVVTVRDRPHSTRKLRAAAARDAEFGRVVEGGDR